MNGLPTQPINIEAESSSNLLSDPISENLDLLKRQLSCLIKFCNQGLNGAELNERFKKFANSTDGIPFAHYGFETLSDFLYSIQDTLILEKTTNGFLIKGSIDRNLIDKLNDIQEDQIKMNRQKILLSPGGTQAVSSANQITINNYAGSKNQEILMPMKIFKGPMCRRDKSKVIWRQKPLSEKRTSDDMTVGRKSIGIDTPHLKKWQEELNLKFLNRAFPPNKLRRGYCREEMLNLAYDDCFQEFMQMKAREEAAMEKIVAFSRRRLPLLSQLSTSSSEVSLQGTASFKAEIEAADQFYPREAPKINAVSSNSQNMLMTQVVWQKIYDTLRLFPNGVSLVDFTIKYSRMHGTSIGNKAFYEQHGVKTLQDLVLSIPYVEVVAKPHNIVAFVLRKPGSNKHFASLIDKQQKACDIKSKKKSADEQGGWFSEDEDAGEVHVYSCGYNIKGGKTPLSTAVTSKFVEKMPKECSNDLTQIDDIVETTPPKMMVNDEDLASIMFETLEAYNDSGLTINQLIDQAKERCIPFNPHALDYERVLAFFQLNPSLFNVKPNSSGRHYVRCCKFDKPSPTKKYLVAKKFDPKTDRHFDDVSLCSERQWNVNKYLKTPRQNTSPKKEPRELKELGKNWLLPPGSEVPISQANVMPLQQGSLQPKSEISSSTMFMSMASTSNTSEYETAASMSQLGVESSAKSPTGDTAQEVFMIVSEFQKTAGPVPLSELIDLCKENLSNSDVTNEREAVNLLSRFPNVFVINFSDKTVSIRKVSSIFLESIAKMKIHDDLKQEGAVYADSLYKKLNFEAGERLNVHVSILKSPDDIYVHLLKLKSNYEELSRKMQSFYNAPDSSRFSVPTCFLTSGYCCAALVNQIWCRVEIVYSFSLSFVFCIDTGESSQIPTRDLRVLQRDFIANKYPAMAIKVSLAGIEPLESTWSSDATELLKNYIESANNSVMSVVSMSESNTPEVTFYVQMKDTKDLVSLADQLVKKTFAKYKFEENFEVLATSTISGDANYNFTTSASTVIENVNNETVQRPASRNEPSQVEALTSRISSVRLQTPSEELITDDDEIDMQLDLTRQTGSPIRNVSRASSVAGGSNCSYVIMPTPPPSTMLPPGMPPGYAAQGYWPPTPYYHMPSMAFQPGMMPRSVSQVMPPAASVTAYSIMQQPAYTFQPPPLMNFQTIAPPPHRFPMPAQIYMQPIVYMGYPPAPTAVYPSQQAFAGRPRMPLMRPPGN